MSQFSETMILYFLASGALQKGFINQKQFTVAIMLCAQKEGINVQKSIYITNLQIMYFPGHSFRQCLTNQHQSQQQGK